MGTRSAVEGIYCSNIGTERDWSPTMFNGMHRLWLLDISGSHDLYFPEGNLKFVDLNYFSSLNDILALYQAPNLVSIDLTGCSSLHQVPPLRFRVCDELTSLDHSSDR
ncbi:hypothetical protein TIFTF001_029601 [Ficus carica]|nr:hypothetical protein TIFTF001_029601 [Ficus carica]